jgi:hypothetical protein
MQYLNKANLPQYLVDWLINDEYDYNTDLHTVSATTLMKPARAYWLTLRHGDDLEIDVTDLIASRLGSAIHNSIEQVKTPGVTKEQRVTRVLNIDGTEYTVRGKFDVLVEEGGKRFLRDIKTTSVWAYIYGGKDEDYKKQLSIYRWLLESVTPVEPVAFIDFLFTDWSGTKAKMEDSYPSQRIIAGYKIELMSLAETENYIRERLLAFFAFKDKSDTDLPLCSKEELWASDDTFAVMKPGAQRATKVCDSKEEALVYIGNKSVKNGYVEYRQGKVKRCKYCSAAPFCSQYKSLQKAGLIDYF